jgi:hypothetical protein
MSGNNAYIHIYIHTYIYIYIHIYIYIYIHIHQYILPASKASIPACLVYLEAQNFPPRIYIYIHIYIYTYIYIYIYTTTYTSSSPSGETSFLFKLHKETSNVRRPMTTVMSFTREAANSMKYLNACVLVY